MDFSAPLFSVPLLAWFDRAGRKHLPWQREPSPYRVWVSEIMLQQTQVTTVIPYYQRFMERFPDIHSLAAAPVDEVLHLWTGLGYYARARNLHRTAQYIVRECQGIFPCTLEAVQALPGIGRSTAGAILSLALNQRHPILDGNVKRVLTRYFGISGHTAEKAVENRLWQLAEQCTPQERVAHYTQAVMDLGATLCTRSKPRCGECPIHSQCVAKRDHLQTSLPTPKPKRLRPKRKAVVLVAVNAVGAILLERRPASGIWGSLWAFPQFDDEAGCLAFLGSFSTAEDRPPVRLPSYRHAFSHFDLDLQPLLVRDAKRMQVADSDAYCWYDPASPPRIGLATPVRNIIQQVGIDRVNIGPICPEP